MLEKPDFDIRKNSIGGSFAAPSSRKKNTVGATPAMIFSKSTAFMAF
jgi:hypothetical protein